MDGKVQSPQVLNGIIRGIKFSISSFDEICKYSINECPITHPSQLSNPFLGLPLESGKCEACGTAENGNCEGHFGYIELPVPIFHPSHISELRDLLSLVCLKCLRMKKAKIKDGKTNASGIPCFYCKGLKPIYIKEVKTSDGAICLELSISSRNGVREGFWSFLDKFGYHYDDGTHRRPLLPTEALSILEKLSEETKKKLSAKGFFAQVGYIMQFLPVPPNCLLLPEISDGKSIMSTDISISLLKRVLSKIENIKRSRSGQPNFESHEVECNDLQLGIAEYMHLRGTTKTPHDSSTKKFIMGQDAIKSSSKQWLEKMKTLFISKGSGFSSRSVITGDTYTGVDQIGIPSEIAKRVTFEDRVNRHNIEKLQKLVDDRLCVTYKDGNSTYAIAVGAQGHTTLKVGQVITRSIIDGDIIFINRPPSTHKHSLQAFTAYIHNDHTVKINPLVCAPLGADFDGDCVHIFYPQSLAAKAEVMELFCVDQQLLSSHTGRLNFQLANDSLLSLKFMANTFLKQESAQQLGMLVSKNLPPPAVVKAQNSGALWTVHQILQCALPPFLDSFGQRHLINKSEILELEFDRDFLQSSLTDIVSSIFSSKGPKEALNFFNSLQPVLMEVLAVEGFSISLKDFNAHKTILREVQRKIQNISGLLPQARRSYNELLEQQIERDLARLRAPIAVFILQSCLGFLIDLKSESAMNKVIQQVGFLGLQLFDKGKLYSKALVEDIRSNYVTKYLIGNVLPSSEAYGLVKGSLFHGLNPYESFVHSISSREVIIRSSRGLTEPGVLFKNLMAILRDVVITYDGTVRNVCSNSVIQFGYELDNEERIDGYLPAGEPVGVLAATAISTPAYKAVLDSSQNTNSSWESMKEILQCKSSYQNTATDRRVILYLNDCNCGKRFCKEKSALTVQNCLRSVTLKHCAVDFSVVYETEIIADGSAATSGLLGHIHLDMMKLRLFNQKIDGIHRKCEVVIDNYRKKKKYSHVFRRIELSSSEDCQGHPKFLDGHMSDFPCLLFSYRAGSLDETVEEGIEIMTNSILPTLLDTIIKGDPRLETVNLYWTGPDYTSWVTNPNKDVRGEWAIDVVVQKTEAKKSGDAWRLVLDACIPVIHLINTTRTIPYGIKQINHVFGISCAFDQCVQRLSKSIKMVSKGVSKEHLVLVGNTMTCRGSLIGFNTGGFKSLFKSLKVEVPFTEATLFTPMRCFERAAEKCHKDSLGSIVSSISWGRHVAVGTGSNFEIIWGQKNQASSNNEVGKDVYDLLSWVREPHENDTAGACVGSDIEDFLDDYDDGNIPMSPEPYEKPTFEDFNETEKKNNSDNCTGWGNAKPASNDAGWGNTSSQNAQLDNSSHGWDASPLKQSNNDGWGSNDVAKADSSDWGNKVKSSDMGNSSNWNKTPVKDRENNAGWGASKENNTNEPAWGVKKNDFSDNKENNDWTAKKDNNANESSWGVKRDDFSESKQKSAGESSGWGAAKAHSSQKENDTWSAKKDRNKENESVSWGAKEAESPQKKENDPWSIRKDDTGNVNESTWGGNTGGDALSSQKETDKEESSAWGANDNSAWSAKKQVSENIPAWGGNNDNGNNESSNPWVSKRSEDEGATDENSQGWKSRGCWGRGRGGREGGRGRGRGRNDSPRPHGGGRQGGNRAGWGQAVSFTTEEEKILVDIEPLMNTIRRTLREIGDGEHLSPENQKLIIENVLEHHPDKQHKVAGEIDCILVDKHSEFTESRCFYVLLTDGTRSDFSYIKCMENFIKTNYPEHADSFNAKYFKRRRENNEPINQGPQHGPTETQNEPINTEPGQQLQEITDA